MRPDESPTDETPEPVKQFETLQRRSTQSLIKTVLLIAGIFVSGIVSYTQAVDAVQAQAHDVAIKEAAVMVSNHAREDVGKFEKLERRLERLEEKLDKQGAENSRDIKAILLEMRRR